MSFIFLWYLLPAGLILAVAMYKTNKNTNTQIKIAFMPFLNVIIAVMIVFSFILDILKQKKGNK